MSETITNDEELAALLDTLGGTADEVADKLRAAGITGRQGNMSCCPVANWLKQETDSERVSASGGYVGVQSDDWVWCYDVPMSISQFIDHFDDGVYLDLIEEAS